MRWLHEPQSISNQFVGWGFYTTRGGIDTGDLRFRPGVTGVVEIWTSDPGMGTYPPRVRRDPGFGLRGNSHCALGP